MKKYFLVLLVLISNSIYAQLVYKRSINCLEDSFRVNKMIGLTCGKYKDYHKAIEFKNEEVKRDDNISVMSISLFEHMVNGKKKSYEFLVKKLNENKITQKEALEIKYWIALVTKDEFYFRKYKKEYLAKYPESLFNIKIGAKRHLVEIVPFGFKNYDTMKKDLENVKVQVDSVLKIKKMNREETLYFKLLKLDLKNGLLSMKISKKNKKALKKINKKYSDLIYNSYYDVLINDLSISKTFLGVKPFSYGPSLEDKEDWKIFKSFLDENPLYNELGSNGLTIIDYPQTDTDEKKDYLEAVEAFNFLIKKYPEIKSFKEHKFHIISVFGDIEGKGEQVHCYKTISSFIDLAEVDASHSMVYSGGEFEFESDYYFQDRIKELSAVQIKELLKKTNESLKREPEHPNLIKLRELLLNYKE
ncbi:hypothetical protein [Aureivirga sp. CE67]|uniref:hypothetical protein n=1 Tax=Aureivirga sp. CE67 TaxID=1788983 RepID=UPI0018C97942|nr:hypothetical protein [Aureivirga sp. CE67]